MAYDVEAKFGGDVNFLFCIVFVLMNVSYIALRLCHELAYICRMAVLGWIRLLLVRTGRNMFRVLFVVTIRRGRMRCCQSLCS